MLDGETVVERGRAPKSSSVVGKVLYAVLFVAVLPALLLAWAFVTDASVPLPVVGSPLVGVAVSVCGGVLMLSGMAALMVYGKGLPMNAYPPARYVTRGAYRLTAHPIYAGFSILCVGAAVAADSPAGLWLVSPVVMLGCVALVQGFEKHDLQRRFGHSDVKPLIRLPGDEAGRPTFADVISVYVLVLLPWLILYEAVRLIGVPKDAFVAYFPFEKYIPVYEATELVYASTYALVLLAPLVARTRRDLREFAIRGLFATGLVTLLFLVVPLVAPPRPFVPRGPLGELLTWERALDTPAAAFPSFHVVWALLAARAYAARARSWRFVWWGWAVAVSLSCVTTGMHAVVDVAAGFVTFLFVTRFAAVWEAARGLTERVANSWREWRVGPVRIINHGLYAGAGAFVSLSIFGALAGADHVVAMLVIATSILVASALWAQLVEGSPSLLRPYGWYGGVIGAVLGVAVAGLLGADPWLLAGACCVAAPWLQAVGRLRCLVQGCCHGREAPASVGIRYTHPRSRVCKLSGLAGVPVHPTPLYSILSNVVIAVVVARLWQLRASLSLVVGVYLILTGLARFVEESYRGEPQTAVRAGLKLYQWMAILSVVAGVSVTMIVGAPSAPEIQFNRASVAAAFCFGLFAWFALGVDFPDSNRRFARLA
ncbi:MAG: prolipoprotein diacylglyceryl transferase [Acidobacteria bacterium]|nr:prolipoprotein diacylglyceryl transferase [Acidobacteriota bacterium]